MGSVWDLSNSGNRERFDAHISNLLLSGKKPRVEVLPEKRSLDQNAMFHALYKQIAEQKQDESMNDITRFCKLHYGVPILRASSEKFRDMYDRVIKGHDYETKLEMMEFLPVTRLFNKEQGSVYIDTIIQKFSQQGLSLLHPSEMNW